MLFRAQGKSDDLLRELTNLAEQRLKAQSKKSFGDYLKDSGKFLAQAAAQVGIEVLIKHYAGIG